MSGVGCKPEVTSTQPKRRDWPIADLPWRPQIWTGLRL